MCVGYSLATRTLQTAHLPILPLTAILYVAAKEQPDVTPIEFLSACVQLVYLCLGSGAASRIEVTSHIVTLHSRLLLDSRQRIRTLNVIHSRYCPTRHPTNCGSLELTLFSVELFQEIPLVCHILDEFRHSGVCVHRAGKADHHVDTCSIVSVWQ